MWFRFYRGGGPSLALFGLALAALCAMPNPGMAQALALGSVTNNGAVKCPSAPGTAAKGAVCYAVTVNCPNTVPLSGWVAIANPGAPIGTVTMMGAGPGTLFFTDTFANKYLSLGYQTAQIAFASTWEDSGESPYGSVLAAACRPATLFNWVYANFHQGAKTLPYCLQGFSGGSGAVSYALTHYGLKSIADAAMFTAGPAMGDMVKGCTSPPGQLQYNAIPECGSGWRDYYTIYPTVGSVLSYPDKWEHTTTCSNNPSPADEAVWANTSIDSIPADYNYPQTKLSSFQCTGNGAPGQGMFFFDNVEAQSPSSISAFGCAHGGSNSGPTGCNGEMYWEDNGTGTLDKTRFTQMITQMQTDCVARH